MEVGLLRAVSQMILERHEEWGLEIEKAVAGILQPED
jgi:hypothetical protein